MLFSVVNLQTFAVLDYQFICLFIYLFDGSPFVYIIVISSWPKKDISQFVCRFHIEHKSRNANVRTTSVDAASLVRRVQSLA